MTELTKEIEKSMREQLASNKLTDEELNELYNSERYNMTTDQLVAEMIESYDVLTEMFDTTAEDVADNILGGFDQAIETTKLTKKLEIELFNVGENAQGYLDRLVDAIGIVKNHYAKKFAA